MAQTPATTTPPKVARLATEKAAIDPDGLILLGISGPRDSLRALLRLPSGRTAAVSRGTAVGSQVVTAIALDHIVLANGDRSSRIDLP